MSAERFTPGPWAIHSISSTAVVGSRGYIVAACGGYSNNTVDSGELLEELEANARLIAAAPELLNLLTVCVAVLKIVTTGEDLESNGIMRDAIEISEAAIAAATRSQQ